MAPITLDIEYDPRINWAMERNGIPIVQALRLTNRSEVECTGLTLALQLAPDFGPRFETRIASIPPGATHTLRRPDIELDGTRLRSVLERERGELRIDVSGGETLLRESRPIEVLAFNEWNRAALPELLAAFVLPNHPSIATLLETARDLLEEATGNPGFTGYQHGGRDRVRAIVEAIYRAIQCLEITYVPPPASFESTGQKIRFPDQVLEHRMGTCLDLTVLMAACLEHCGQHPILLLVGGHAFPGCWLVEDWLPMASSDDPETVARLIAAGEILVFDSSTVTDRPFAPITEAEEVARRHLQERSAFEQILDVRAARLARILPLPVLVAEPAQSLPPRLPPLGEEPPLTDARGGSLESATRAEAPATPPAARAGAATPIAPAPTATHAPAETAASRLGRWKERLLDLSLRNRLLNFRPTRRTVALDIPELHELEDLLSSGSRLSLHPQSALHHGDPREAKLLEKRGAEELLHEQRLDLLRRKRVITKHDGDDLDERLLELYRQARSELEECGASTLYLTIGMLRWFETEASRQERLAPILLYPVQISRPSASERFHVRLTDDEPRLNDTLFEKLQVSLGLDFRELEEVPLDEAGIDVAKVLDIVSKAVARMPRFAVLNESFLGFFSFTKFLMWRDLDHHHEELLQNTLVRHLVSGGSDMWPESGPFPDPRELDRTAPPGRTPLVLDADSSQQVAVEAALAGRSFVLQGPPGTGKSQTIANIIAAAVAAGKRVLFVAEKRAALEVVAKRLRNVGLRDACLELHSNKANKRAVVTELARVLEATEAGPPPEDPRLPEKVEHAAGQLNGYAEALHRATPLGLTHFEAASRLGELPARREIEIEFSDVLQTEKSAHEGRLEKLAALAEAAADLESLATHPFAACRVAEWTQLRARQWEKEIEALRVAADRLVAVDERAARALALAPDLPIGALDTVHALLALLAGGCPHPARTLLARADASEALERLAGLCAPAHERSRLVQGLSPYLDARVLAHDLTAWLAAYRRYARAFPGVRWWGLRHAKSELAAFVKDARVSPVRILQALEVAAEAKALGEKLDREQSFLAEVLGAAARGRETEPETLDCTVAFTRQWLEARGALAESAPGRLLASPPDLPGGEAQRLAQELKDALAMLRPALATAVASLAVDTAQAFGGAGEAFSARAAGERARQWLEALPKLREWARFIAAENPVLAEGLEPLRAELRQGTLSPRELTAAYEKAFLREWVDHSTEASLELRSFNGREQDRLAGRFRKHDEALIADGGRVVAGQVFERKPTLTGEAVPGSEVSILQREARKKRRHLAVRRLLEMIPHLLPRLKPCFLMSPLSIAQYLPPSAAAFDLVIFDEASQIPTHDAVGAIARGRQVIVVGDTKQLPPTTFFDVMFDEEEENEVAVPDDELVHELESILDECVASCVSSLMLRWHYRSRDERLIAFSNWHYYENRLLTFPAASSEAAGFGVSLVPVEGTFDRGRSRRNRVEAEAIVRWITAALLDPAQRSRSIGVVTFNQSQQMLVEDLLDDARRAHPEIEPFFDDRAAEPVLVKNLENVQGDERDVVLFSITYGPDREGRTSMNFGPLNREGGERRLNVAITRAREQLIVFSTLRPEMIDLTRTRALGVEHLKEFLLYAAQGPAVLPMATPEGARPESPLLRAIHNRLTERGHKVDRLVGCAGYRIDLAIKDPSDPTLYRLGIECDGPAYRAAATARDRDRLRQAVLEKLGWTMHRIWSPDWWHDPEGEIERIERALAKARREGTRASAGGANAGLDLTGLSSARADEESESESNEEGTIERAREEQARAIRQEQPSPRESRPARESPPPQLAAMSPPAAETLAAETTGTAALPPYEPFVTEILGSQEDFVAETSQSVLCDLVQRIVEHEGPIHREELYRRALGAYAIGRLGQRVEEHLDKVLAKVERSRGLKRVGDFLWPRALDPATYESVRGPSSTGEVRDIRHIAPEELAEAVLRVLRAAVSIPADDLARAAAQMLGYRRLTGRTRERLEEVIHSLALSERCIIEGDTVRLP
ncbi:MAG: DUF3320 domain-containing protein [Planctomycetota bacterium]